MPALTVSVSVDVAAVRMFFSMSWSFSVQSDTRLLR